MHPPASRFLWAALGVFVLACTGSASPGSRSDDDGDNGAGAAGTGGRTRSGGNGGSTLPIDMCAPAINFRLTRVGDRRLARVMGSLFGVPSPTIVTGANDADRFVPDQAATVTEGVAAKLREAAEEVAAAATRAGQPSVSCTGDETACARAFVERVAPRVLRRPLAGGEAAALLSVYASGREIHGNHAGGVSLVIQALLQSPSFLYHLDHDTPHERATRVSLFLRDAAPDDAMWTAVENGTFDSAEGIKGQVAALLERGEVKANVVALFSRWLELPDLERLSKSAAFTHYTPELVRSMRAESEALIEHVAFTSRGRLADLLTSRWASVDAVLAKHYGVASPAGQGRATVMLPPAERAGILTRAASMALRAGGEESSAIFRGLMVARALLCVNPPAPNAEDMEIGEAINHAEPTERARAEKRATLTRCRGCHALFDPVGLTFEHYDATGAYRDTIATPSGEVPVDATAEIRIADLSGRVDDAVALSETLAGSASARACLVQQVAGYALGRHLDDGELCATGDLVARLEKTDGTLLQLIAEVAAWPGLFTRRGGMP